MAKRPSSDALLLAADWLDSYDEETEEHVEIAAVAKWLREQAKDANLRAIAREHGLPVGRLRYHLKRVAK